MIVYDVEYRNQLIAPRFGYCYLYFYLLHRDMPGLRSFCAMHLRNLRDSVAPSIVQLAICPIVKGRVDDAKPILLGTGLVLSRTHDHIGIITTINCHQREGYAIVARFDDENNLEVEVVTNSGLLFGLVVRGHDLTAVACIPASFYCGDIPRSEPVFALGCLGAEKGKIIVTGLVSVGDYEKVLRRIEIESFVHSCPIGDGLIGAPVFNSSGEVLGINVARTPQSSTINFALKVDDFREMLAGLVGVETDVQIPQLLELFSEQISRFESRKEKHGPKRKAEVLENTGGTGEAEGSRRRHTSMGGGSRRGAKS
ncbi:uncharacterized protein LOC119301625 isoform X1 [Triticum dicoccoides]|uniref:uncharacterized protein LOC119301625 isoform X1 n=2 Tax=Triticum dicoccoides TaxID=85692 RepID=UPI000E7C9FCA|nr:uncharacterized protein LOC119301625 isoform X1 [Triticum dicoccoides]